MSFRAIGSLWGKWDLHFHTPSSYDYHNKAVKDQDIVEELVKSGVVAVAITDHHVIDTARIKKLQSLSRDDLTVFPGIELRSELGGKESVHLIGIFSETCDSGHIWAKLQGPLKITSAEVAQKGHDHVYVRFQEAADLIHELGGIVSVHVGRKSNSIENIGNNHPYKRAFKGDLTRDYTDLFEVGQLRDLNDYRGIVFPKIGVEKPLIICSDNHNALDYVTKADCWFKADPSFSAFQQVISDPQERVYIGDTPPPLARVRQNSTKYMKSLSFRKIPTSNLDEDWFSGLVPLNSGLIAVIGNKGTGKTALAESLGLLGNTSQHEHFSFLHTEKFRQLKNNKAKNFEATLEWEDGHISRRLLSDGTDRGSSESVGYIPQNYLETICNEIQTSDSRFDRELKSVIFSHVDDADKLGADSLDELLKFLTDQTHARLEHLRSGLKEINETIVELEQRGSKDSRQLLLSQIGDKERELEAYDKLRPVEVTKPTTDPSKQHQLEQIADKIEKKQQEKASLTAKIKEMDSDMRVYALRQAVSDRLIKRLRNFEAQYEAFINESTADCLELQLKPRNLVKVQVDNETLTKISSEAKEAGQTSREHKANIENNITVIDQEITDLTQQLDAANVQYQEYLKKMEEWKERRAQIVGDESQAGSLNYVKRQITSLENIPSQLEQSRAVRQTKIREIHRELQQLVSTYKSLYTPVQQFIADHVLAGKFTFGFEASIFCSGLEDEFFRLVNQGRRGSFLGADEGRKVLRDLINTADFDSEDGAADFANTLFEHMTHDKREQPSPELPISRQLKDHVNEPDLLDLIFSLSYLVPRYSLKWSGKNIEELSPGERGTLLLIFYLLVDKRDTPLIIDQPEENLDNHTVYDLLVPCIKEARKKRQVIIVTHNPNLAVVCDADQVIHCTIDKRNRNKVTYESGSLENPIINKFTINVLEGTRPAFDRRDDKYQNPDRDQSF